MSVVSCVANEINASATAEMLGVPCCTDGLVDCNVTSDDRFFSNAWPCPVPEFFLNCSGMHDTTNGGLGILAVLHE